MTDLEQAIAAILDAGLDRPDCVSSLASLVAMCAPPAPVADGLPGLARAAVDALLAQQPLTLRHEPGWVRPRGWPLPLLRRAPVADGSITQQYRPLAVLEYVDEQLRPRRAQPEDTP